MKAVILDDIEELKRLDGSGELALISDFPAQCRAAIRMGRALNLNRKYSACRNIVYSGLGGSAAGADLVRSCFIDEMEVPFYVNRDYTIPGFVGPGTLFVASSYSGDTEETLNAYGLAKKKKAKMVAIASGGRLAALAEKDGTPLVDIPSGYPPRCALGFLFFSSLFILIKAGYLKDMPGDFDETVGVLEALRDDKLAENKRHTLNISKQIAMALDGKFPVVYAASGYITPAALRWRSQFAENSKHLSSAHAFPEMSHNEIMGWQNPREELKRCIAVFLRDSSEDRRAGEKINITKNILQREGFETMEVSSIGTSLLARLFSLVYIGDFASFYLAVLNRVDPAPVDKITYLKERLKK